MADGFHITGPDVVLEAGGERRPLRVPSFGLFERLRTAYDEALAEVRGFTAEAKAGLAEGRHDGGADVQEVARSVRERVEERWWQLLVTIIGEVSDRPLPERAEAPAWLVVDADRNARRLLVAWATTPTPTTPEG